MPYNIDDARLKEVIRNIRYAIGAYLREHGITYAVFGKSEGLDSSCIAALLSGIDGVRPIAAIMPCESSIESERLARLVLGHFKIPYVRVDLTKEYHYVMGQLYAMEGVNGQLSAVLDAYGDPAAVKALPHKKARASGNVKARLRMICLYHIAQLTGGLVVSTDNLSELMMGFWTLNGDVGDLAPIQHVLKGLEEYDLARALGVPEEAIGVAPTDGLDVIPGGTDQDQLGLSYPDLDRVIVRLMQEGHDGSQMPDEGLCKRISEELGLNMDAVISTALRMSATHFKRNWPRSLGREEIGLPPIGGISFVSSQK